MGGGRLGHCASSGWLAMASRTAWFGVCVCAGLELADGDDLVPCPDSDGEGAGGAAQDGIWTVIGPLQGWDDAAAVHPDEGAAQEVRRELLWKQAAGVVFARRVFAGDPTKNQ